MLGAECIPWLDVVPVLNLKLPDPAPYRGRLFGRVGCIQLRRQDPLPSLAASMTNSQKTISDSTSAPRALWLAVTTELW